MQHAKRQTSLRTEALDLSGTPLIRAQASISREENTPVGQDDHLVTRRC